MTKRFFPLFALGLFLISSPCEAAVLITTGKDSQGRAYLEFSTPITLQITTTASVIDFGLLIKDTFPIDPPIAGYGTGGSGLYGSTGYPNGSGSFNYWTYGMTLSEVFLGSLDGASNSVNFVAGQAFVIQPGRFVTTNAVSGSFPIFASGYYEAYLVDAFSETILSANAVPEPSVFALLIAGGLVALARRSYGRGFLEKYTVS